MKEYILFLQHTFKTYTIAFVTTTIFYVEAMIPDADQDICDPEFTRWSKESYRNGTGDFWHFWEHHVGNLFQRMSVGNLNSAGEPLAQLKPILNEINQLPDILVKRVDQDRMKWFKYWTNRAVELYGDEAYITFR